MIDSYFCCRLDLDQNINDIKKNQLMQFDTQLAIKRDKSKLSKGK